MWVWPSEGVAAGLIVATSNVGVGVCAWASWVAKKRRSRSFGRIITSSSTNVLIKSFSAKKHSALLLQSRLLIDPDHIAARIAKSRRNLRRISADRLHNLASIRHNRFDRPLRVLDHHVNQKPRL